MYEQINAGLIGYGYAGQTIHAPLLAGTPGIQLHAIVSRDGDKVRADWPDVEHFTQSEQLFADPAIDLVVIATPNDTHFPLARAALLAGKHVVIDKPFTLDSREARQLISLAQEQELQLAVFHNRRRDADFLTLQRLIERGELGDIYHFESHFDRFRPQVRDRWREQAVPGSGLWYDLGSHLLDQSVQLFGMPDNLWLDLARQRTGAKTDDAFHAILQYGERRVILHASTQVVEAQPRFIVHGSQGSYSKYGLDCQEEQLKDGLTPADEQFGVDPRPGRLVTVRGEQRRVQSLTNQRGDYPGFYTAMTDAIRRGTPVPVRPEEALQVMELIELGLRSAREGRRLSPGQLDSVVTTAARQASANLPVGHRGSEVLRNRPVSAPASNPPASPATAPTTAPTSAPTTTPTAMPAATPGNAQTATRSNAPSATPSAARQTPPVTSAARPVFGSRPAAPAGQPYSTRPQTAPRSVTPGAAPASPVAGAPVSTAPATAAASGGTVPGARRPAVDPSRPLFRQPGPMDRETLRQDSPAVPPVRTGASLTPVTTPQPIGSAAAQRPPVMARSTAPQQADPHTGHFRFGQGNLPEGGVLASSMIPNNAADNDEPRLGDLSQLDSLDNRDEPRITLTPPTAVPTAAPISALAPVAANEAAPFVAELSPASLLATERAARQASTQDPLLHMHVDDKAHNDDDDLPPFTAS